MKHEPITDKELDAMEARVNAATPGLLQVGFPHDDDRLCVFSRFDEMDIHPHVVAEFPYHETENMAEDADLFLHARSDVPRLIAEVRRLWDELEEIYDTGCFL